ncbi:LytTR family transcriptional regulator DNA-binding domain-containing protein [Clostridium sediminicola]|uniref:LytTR family transcriptional regulator DNA-binding domain-containing protein n=1 Tax=Clostridium sediminicola TaxID=3114879 RepID=UPI0031F23002
MDILTIKEVSKKEKNVTLIDDLNLQLKEGQSISIKTSEDITLLLIDIILGYILPPKGKVYINDINNSQYLKKYRNTISVILKEEGFYERLNVYDYLKFFHRIHDSKFDLKKVMVKFGLLDIAKDKISSLTYSQKKRISFARALISDPKILLVQEPTMNLDRESTLIIRESIPYMNSLGISIIAFSVALEEVILLEADSYMLDENGFKPIESKSRVEESKLEAEKSNLKVEENENSPNEVEESDKPSFKIDKIPVKINEKIILFNPMEINFIESLDGVTYINVGSEKFPCSFTLSKLEERLKYIGFFRCHRSYLVNLQKVREVITWTRNSYSLILDDKNKSSIPLSKGRVEELKGILKL